jgi:hypothetical protein
VKGSVFALPSCFHAPTVRLTCLIHCVDANRVAAKCAQTALWHALASNGGFTRAEREWPRYSVCNAAQALRMHSLSTVMHIAQRGVAAEVAHARGNGRSGGSLCSGGLMLGGVIFKASK